MICLRDTWPPGSLLEQQKKHKFSYSKTFQNILNSVPLSKELPEDMKHQIFSLKDSYRKQNILETSGSRNSFFSHPFPVFVCYAIDLTTEESIEENRKFGILQDFSLPVKLRYVFSYLPYLVSYLSFIPVSSSLFSCFSHLPFSSRIRIFLKQFWCLIVWIIKNVLRWRHFCILSHVFLVMSTGLSFLGHFRVDENGYETFLWNDKFYNYKLSFHVKSYLCAGTYLFALAHQSELSKIVNNILTKLDHVSRSKTEYSGTESAEFGTTDTLPIYSITRNHRISPETPGISRRPHTRRKGKTVTERLVSFSRLSLTIWILLVAGNALFFIGANLSRPPQLHGIAINPSASNSTSAHTPRTSPFGNETIGVPIGTARGQSRLVRLLGASILIREGLWALFGFGWIIATVLFALWLAYALFLVDQCTVQQCPLVSLPVVNYQSYLTRRWSSDARNGRLGQLYSSLAYINLAQSGVNAILGCFGLAWLCELFLSSCIRITQLAMLTITVKKYEKAHEAEVERQALHEQLGLKGKGFGLRAPQTLQQSFREGFKVRQNFKDSGDNSSTGNGTFVAPQTTVPFLYNLEPFVEYFALILAYLSVIFFYEWIQKRKLSPAEFENVLFEWPRERRSSENVLSEWPQGRNFDNVLYERPQGPNFDNVAYERPRNFDNVHSEWPQERKFDNVHSEWPQGRIIDNVVYERPHKNPLITKKRRNSSGNSQNWRNILRRKHWRRNWADKIPDKKRDKKPDKIRDGEIICLTRAFDDYRAGGLVAWGGFRFDFRLLFGFVNAAAPFSIMIFQLCSTD